MNAIAPEYLRILKPLIDEMIRLNETLDQDEFVESAFNLYQTLSITDKHLLLEFNAAAKTKPKDFPFHPKINA